MKANLKIYEGKNEKILATASITFADNLEILGFKVIKSSFGNKPVFYPPSYMATNGNGYNLISNKTEKWKEIENLLSKEFAKESLKFKKKSKKHRE